MASLLVHGKRQGIASRVREGDTKEGLKNIKNGRWAQEDGIGTIIVTPNNRRAGAHKIGQRAGTAQAVQPPPQTGRCGSSAVVTPQNGERIHEVGCAHTRAAHAGAWAGKGGERKKVGKLQNERWRAGIGEGGG